MKMKTKYILLSALMLIFAVGCEKYLDIPKHGNMGGQDEFYQTDEQAMQALASLYGTWDGIYSNWFYAKNLLSDDAFAGGGNRGDTSDGGTRHARQGAYGGRSQILPRMGLLRPGDPLRTCPQGRPTARSRRIPHGQQHGGTAVGVHRAGSQQGYGSMPKPACA